MIKQPEVTKDGPAYLARRVGELQDRVRELEGEIILAQNDKARMQRLAQQDHARAGDLEDTLRSMLRMLPRHEVTYRSMIEAALGSPSVPGATLEAQRAVAAGPSSGNQSGLALSSDGAPPTSLPRASEARCPWSHRIGYDCELPEGHVGNHVATDLDGKSQVGWEPGRLGEYRRELPRPNDASLLDDRPMWDLIERWLVKHGLQKHAGTVMHYELARQVTDAQRPDKAMVDLNPEAVLLRAQADRLEAGSWPGKNAGATKWEADQLRKKADAVEAAHRVNKRGERNLAFFQGRTSGIEECVEAIDTFIKERDAKATTAALRDEDDEVDNFIGHMTGARLVKARLQKLLDDEPRTETAKSEGEKR